MIVDNELKVILLLSGLHKDIKDGGNYEELNYNCAKDIVKIFRNPDGLEEIIQSICTMQNISTDLFLSGERTRYLSEARAAYCIIAKEKYPNKPIKDIASTMNKHHATVLHHLKNSSVHKSVKAIVKQII